MKKHNFSAGPCILPQEVFQKSAQAVLDFNNSGLSILEISHRSKDFVDVMENARELALELLGLQGKGYKALFLQGGASTQFLMVAYNIPKGYSIPDGLDYVHMTSNNTIFGTQVKDFPKTDAPLICDMSSDIFSRTLDFSQFGLIYAGAQKNMGPAGTTLVVVKEDILKEIGRKIPSMLDYKIHISKGAMFNTPPVYSIYVSMLTMEWLKSKGGIAAIEEENEKKATLIYSEIDLNPLFEGFAAKEDRSIMNATFNLTNGDLKETFDAMLKEGGINGANGHRSVGGYRASMYNAMTLESVGALVDIMSDLERKA